MSNAFFLKATVGSEQKVQQIATAIRNCFSKLKSSFSKDNKPQVVRLNIISTLNYLLSLSLLGLTLHPESHRIAGDLLHSLPFTIIAVRT
jgi:hypothetical protein